MKLIYLPTCGEQGFPFLSSSQTFVLSIFFTQDVRGYFSVVKQQTLMSTYFPGVVGREAELKWTGSVLRCLWSDRINEPDNGYLQCSCCARREQPESGEARATSARLRGQGTVQRGGGNGFNLKAPESNSPKKWVPGVFVLHHALDWAGILWPLR